MMDGHVHRLFVGGITQTVSKSDLLREFSKFGTVANVWIARNPPGFAFVDFEKSSDGEKAVRALDGSSICNSKLRVEFAHNRQRTGDNSHSDRGGSRRTSNALRNDRSPPTRRYDSPPPRRGRSPRVPPVDVLRYPYEQLAALYNPDMLNVAATAATFPYQIPGYPAVLPFIPHKDMLRNMQPSSRRRSPIREHSPAYRRRSRSPIDCRPHRYERGPNPHAEDYDRYNSRRDDYRPSRGHSQRGRDSPPPPQISGPPLHRRINRSPGIVGRRPEYEREAPRSNGDRRRR